MTLETLLLALLGCACLASCLMGIASTLNGQSFSRDVVWRRDDHPGEGCAIVPLCFTCSGRAKG